jgi:hypothetical protein
MYGMKQTSGAYYFYGNNFTTFRLYLKSVAGTATTSCAIQIFRDEGGIDVEVGYQTQSLNATQAMEMQYTPILAGYYAMRVVSDVSVAMAYNMKFTIEGRGSTMAHRPVIDFENNLSRMQGFRVLGGSIMLSNFTNLYQVVGVMSGAIIPGNRSLMEILQTGTSSKLMAGSTTKLIGQENSENGMRVWLRPSGIEDYAINENVETFNGVVIDAHADLYTSSNYAIIYYQNQSSNALQVCITSCLRMEYYTQDNWTDQRTPMATPDEWSAAHEIIKHVPSITANPIHWLAIAKSILGGLHKYAGTVGNYVGKFAGAINDMI